MSCSRKQKKVLFLTTADNIGGMERVVCSLARQFAGRGWPVQTVFPEGGNRDALLEWCRAQGVDAQTSPALLNAAAAHTRQDMRRLTKFVRQAHPAIVNLHYGDNAISLKDVLAVRMAGRHRCVVTVNHPTPWGETERSKRMLTRLAAVLAHKIVVISRATRQVLLEAGVPARKIALIPCGMPVPDARPNRAQARARSGLPEEAFIVGTLARLVAHKGIADLVEAAARVPDPNTELRLAVAGEGPERGALEALATERLKDRAIFLGRVPDVNDFYAACDVFALPSHLEGFGLVYAEAAFHGIPSIGTNVGGCPDVVEDGQTGLLVAPGDAAALARALERLQADPALRQRLGEAARARAHAEFTEQVMAERYQQIFRT